MSFNKYYYNALALAVLGRIAALGWSPTLTRIVKREMYILTTRRLKCRDYKRMIRVLIMNKLISKHTVYQVITHVLYNVMLNYANAHHDQSKLEIFYRVFEHHYPSLDVDEMRLHQSRALRYFCKHVKVHPSFDLMLMQLSATPRFLHTLVKEECYKYLMSNFSVSRLCFKNLCILYRNMCRGD